MKFNSFRLKIALTSGVLTSLLLVGFGYGLWRISYQLSLDQLDRELRNLGQANLDRVQGGEHWVRLEQSLKFVAGNRVSTDYVLWVKNYGKVVFQSPDWPTGLAPESLPVPDIYAGENAPIPGQPLPPPPRRGEQISEQNPALPLKSPLFFRHETGGKTWRIAVMGNPYVTLILGADMDEFNASMAKLRNAGLLALVLVLILVAGSAWLVARRALRPVTLLTQAAERVTAKGLDQRLPRTDYEQEFDRLVTVFNAMLARLDKSFQQATRFSADASHELKTPLARLQMELEQALEISQTDVAAQQRFSNMLDEVSRLKAIVQKLLLISLADAGELKLKLEPVNLTQLLENVIEDCKLQATHLTIQTELAPEVRVNADADLLEQALQNLGSNAIKYNQSDGRIDFELASGPNHVCIRVRNTGACVPPDDRERIFDRFYRVGIARSQQVEGVGLGLSLSREIVRAHGGNLVLGQSTDGLTEFILELPELTGQ